MLRRTALIVAVPEAEPAVGALRLAHDLSAALGAPAHITILFPFAAPQQIEEDALREVFAAHRLFDFVLDRVERFPEGPTWLHPEPSEPFVALTTAVWNRWPELPPYEGLHDAPTPHLTVSNEPIEVDVPLPIAARASEVTLIEQEEPGGRWATRLRFGLGQGSS
jgi:2'-5' RNA ligase